MPSLRNIAKVFVSKDRPIKSPVPHLLISNNPPSEEEASLIRAALIDIYKQQEHILEILSFPANESNSMKRHLQKIHLFTIQHQAIMSPVRRLPYKVLQSIFSYFIPKTRRIQGLKNDPRLVLSHVSQHWRKTSISFQELWAVLPRIHLTNSKAKTKRHTIILKELLRRSGNAPLTLCIVNHAFFDTENKPDRSKHPIVALLIAHSERWKKLTWKTSNTKTLIDLQRVKPVFTSLESVKLVIFPLQSQHPERRVNLFDAAPRLAQVSIYCLLTTVYFYLPFSSLKDIYVDSLIIPASVPTYAMPTLTKLFLKVNQGKGHSAWFDNIALPALEEVFLKTGDTSACRTLLSIISRSDNPCCIKRLFIATNPSLDLPGDLPALLKQTPALETLRATAHCSSDILALASLEHQSVLVPDLRQCSLRVNRESGPHIFHAISQLALSRCRPVESLKQYIRVLQVHNNCFIPPMHQQRLLETAPLFNTTASSKLAELAHPLYDTISSPVPFGLRDNSVNYKWITELLTKIEECHDIEPKDIIITNIHQYLKRFSTMLRERVPDHYQDNLDQIDRIFQIWKVYFKSIVDNLHWVYETNPQSSSSMVYIPTNHEIRATPEQAIHLFLHGFSAADKPVLFKEHATFLDEWRKLFLEGLMV